MGSLPHIVEDCMGVLQLFSDGSVHRCSMKDINFPFPVVHDDSVDFKDVVFDKKLNISLRLYRPKSHASATPTNLLPWCFTFTGAVSVSARGCGPTVTTAASASRPGLTRSSWRRTTGSPPSTSSRPRWMTRQGGAGTGAGVCSFGTIFWWRGEDEVGGGSAGDILNLEILDRFWRLSMPKGESRDHLMVNPFGPISLGLKEVDLDPILVMVGGNEMLKDRVEIYSRRLKELGKEIEYVEFDGQQHGFLTNDPYSEVANEALQVIKRFVIENSN
ncbi:hypothetical protein ACLB2K_056098 [Fragaria x ananassa]